MYIMGDRKYRQSKYMGMILSKSGARERERGDAMQREHKGFNFTCSISSVNMKKY